MIHYTQIIWEEVAFIWKVTGKAVTIFMTGTVYMEKILKDKIFALICRKITKLWVMKLSHDTCTINIAGTTCL